MTDKQKELLEIYGWKIECELPLEIYHKDSHSRATNMAAKMVINLIENEQELYG